MKQKKPNPAHVETVSGCRKKRGVTAGRQSETQKSLFVQVRCKKLGLAPAETESKYRHFCLASAQTVFMGVQLRLGARVRARTSVSNMAAQWQRFTT